MSQRQTYKGCTCGQCDVYRAPEQWCDGTGTSRDSIRQACKMTQLVNIHHGTRYDVDIRRPGEYGNPILLGETCPLCGAVHTRKYDGTAALVCTARHFYARLQNNRQFERQVIELQGQTLGCVCMPAPCHGEIFLAYIAASTHQRGLHAIQQLEKRWQLGQKTLCFDNLPFG